MLAAPKSSQELKKMLPLIGEKDFFLAGGTDLMIFLKDSTITDYNIIDLTKITEWKEIEVKSEEVTIGALVTMAELLESELIQKEYGAIYQAAYDLGSTQIRNLATIGGNVAHASQSADVLLALFALNAKVILFTPQEQKILPIEEVVIGKEKTSLAKNEVIAGFVLPRKGRCSAFRKIGARKAVTISKISVAVDFEYGKGKMEDVRLYLGAVGVRPVRGKWLESYMEGKTISQLERKELRLLAEREILEAIPTRPSRFYKKEAAQGMMEELLEELMRYDGL